MTDEQRTEYVPRSVSPPGETLAETLEELQITQAELARRMGRPIKTINEIVRGKAAILPETAFQLEMVTDVPANFWMARETAYRVHLAQKARHAAEQTGEAVEWARRFPCRAMAEWGWIQRHSRAHGYVHELYSFFRVASPEAWTAIWNRPEVAFRRSLKQDGNPFAIAAWLRQGEIQAQPRTAVGYDPESLRQVLAQARALTAEEANVFVPALQRSCATAGVIVEFVPELPGARVSGATRWLNPNRALIQLSFRFKTNDQLWFSFFHEAAHVLRHPRKGIFIDEGSSTTALEVEADRFASGILIPDEAFREFASHHPFSRQKVVAFASAEGIAPGVVVGRLQHEGLLPYGHLNDLKAHLRWESVASARVVTANG
ncbi:MAG: ImmA/IrrE family metallo-endopeptidase [Holophagales bacterium]|nr:ImmA/IrrE family metallo-endopeptidase [Holophagales bacterium]